MLLGKIIITGVIETKTGLRIGGTTGGLKIGGVDLNVITDAEDKPYIPGSSLKGKMRSLLEHKENKISPDGKVHYCRTNDEYINCSICKIFGITPTEKDIKITLPTPTRLFVRDTSLDEESLKGLKLELKWTEVKTETTIHRIKGSAYNPREIERVPAGARFSPMEIIYNVYEEEDKDILIKVFEAMELLEDDYLGGMGSRGYGKIEFKNIEIFWNKREDYESGKLNQNKINNGFDTPSKIVENFDQIRVKL